MAALALSLARLTSSMELVGISLWISLFYYMLIAFAGIGMLVLLMAGYWLGIFFATMMLSAFMFVIAVGIGQAAGKRWATRLARILFMR